MSILINFGHPLTETQLQKIIEISGIALERVVYLPAKFDHMTGFNQQVQKLVDEIDLSAEEWQTEKILINPPSLNSIAIALLSELHGRMGYFPSCIRLRPVQGANPPQFEVAEILNLQEIRDQARTLR